MPGIDSFTKVMLHMNGTNGSTTFTDSSLSPKTFTSVNGAAISTVDSKFGGASGLFTGASNHYITTPDSDDFYFGTGNFTIDFWVNLTSLTTPSSEGIYVSQWFDSDNHWILVREDTTKWKFRFKSGTVTQGEYITTSGVSMSVGTWAHIECSRNGSGALFFLNGTSQPLTTVTAFGTNDVGNTAAILAIGRSDSVGEPINAYLDELRISKGTVRHTGDFTPPSAEYDTSTITITSNANQAILLC